MAKTPDEIKKNLSKYSSGVKVNLFPKAEDGVIRDIVDSMIEMDGSDVDSVNGRNGVVILDKDDVNLENIDEKGADIASATTTDLSAATGNFVHITGTTTIEGFGTVDAGVKMNLVFDDALTLTHNATSLILPGSANIVTTAGDTTIIESEGSGNWRVMGYFKEDGSAVASVGSGVLGISDTNGTYTYYDTYTLAMAAASSGDTIQQFADITETDAVTVDLKDGVIIQGNGYTYEVTSASIAFKAAFGATYNGAILNLNVISQGGNALLYDNNSSGIIRLWGSTFTSTNQCFYSLGAGAIEVYGGHFHGNVIGINSAKTDAKFYYTTSNNIYVNNGNSYYNCIANVSGFRVSAGGTLYNCTGISTSSTGIHNLGGDTYNCIAISTTYMGYYGQSGTSTNDLAISVSYWGTQSDGSCVFTNLTSKSSSNYGSYMSGTSTKAFGLTSISTSNAAGIFGNASEILGGYLISKWNNVAGYGAYYAGAVTTPKLIGLHIECSNAGAPYIKILADAASTISTSNNKYQGGGAYNVNITQVIVATEDAQGNIYL